MDEMSIPFNPLREDLYTPDALFGAFDPADSTSYERCADIKILSYFWRMGTNPTKFTGAATLEALHDNSISRGISRYIAKFPNVVAIMGGHGMKRNDPAYAGVAHIAYELAKSGFLLISGGGPGAMEATHLGAFHSNKSEAELDSAIALLAKVPQLPSNVDKLVAKDGSGKIDSQISSALHAWLAPALSIVKSIPLDEQGLSIGIPTWLYGFEPTTPFATLSGKYFQNSIREDGLVTMGVSGIIYAEGSAGTIQEIFQDAAQNYYGEFCPMIFFSSPAADGQHYWEIKYPVRPLIQALLDVKKDFATKVLFTEDANAVVSFLEKLRRV
ncbi:hypothetical protein Terro_3083 [Terriglobus roseus DSM 18391]|uniref:Rossmann fold nucleotide-binding protein n=1 Tax=Terriglobus roseus (strain DSM 18391 / NRRL B-41598 / KBS 63) TaxID=926566 RepID=I3ZJ96_TERRK|nr:hypothetical protein [Terriglobus roseus]AFL89314.1 hypothetical protein Terro_3083 [Terriglobus roseus DSM 18391]